MSVAFIILIGKINFGATLNCWTGIEGNGPASAACGVGNTVCKVSFFLEQIYFSWNKHT